jgi:hypothetical protein
MKQIRTLGMAFVAMLALSAVVASAALAAPEFEGARGAEAKGTTFTGSTSSAKLTAVGTTITCTGGSSSGEITGKKTVGKVVVAFTGCEANSGECKVKSPGAAEGEVKTDTLEGELGEVEQSEASSKVGLDLKAAGKESFVTTEGSCLPFGGSAVTGSIIGEVSPVGRLESEGLLIYKAERGKQKIQKFIGGSQDVLKAFSIAEVVEETTETVKFSKEIKVT